MREAFSMTAFEMARAGVLERPAAGGVLLLQLL